MGEITEAGIARLRHGLSSAQRSARVQRDMPIAAAGDELGLWLSDDRQWIAGYGQQWVSLLDDLLAARDGAGPHLRSYVDAAVGAGWDEISECRRVLKERGRRVPDVAVRRRLHRANQSIHTALLSQDALTAAWADFSECETYEEATNAAGRVLRLASHYGADTESLARRLGAILADSKLEIDLAEGRDIADIGPNEKAGVSPAGRIALARAELSRTPDAGEVVVWLRYALARLTFPPVLDVGNSVTLYAESWLQSALSRDDETLPPELGNEDTRFHLKMLVRADEGDVQQDSSEPVPHVVIRVALGQVETSGSEALARETAELLVSLATLHGADPSIWILTDDHVSSIDGHSGGASYGTPPVFEPTSSQRLAMMDDRTPEILTEWATELTTHLPLRTEPLRRAAQLALWLRRARQTWEPGRLVLCDRIFEQVAGWAGLADRGRFIHDYLRLSWALRQVRNEVHGCWSQVWQSRSAFSIQSFVSDDAWNEIKSDSAIGFAERDGGWQVNLQGVLRRLDFLLARVISDTPPHERLVRLHDRTASGRASAKWVRALLREFDVLERRARRTRNALVHGGPVSDDTARAILPFVEWLAVDALHAAIKGFLSERDLIDHFLDRREQHRRCLSRLENNEPLSEALFWAASD